MNITNARIPKETLLAGYSNLSNINTKSEQDSNKFCLSPIPSGAGGGGEIFAFLRMRLYCKLIPAERSSP